jgi:hypothetical protein
MIPADGQQPLDLEHVPSPGVRARVENDLGVHGHLLVERLHHFDCSIDRLLRGIGGTRVNIGAQWVEEGQGMYNWFQAEYKTRYWFRSSITKYRQVDEAILS